MNYGDISPQVAVYSAARMLESNRLTLSAFVRKPKPPPQYLEVRCSVCEAARGERCRPVRRHFNWIGDKHAERVDDARVVAEAVKALMPEEITVKFRGPRL